MPKTGTAIAIANPLKLTSLLAAGLVVAVEEELTVLEFVPELRPFARLANPTAGPLLPVVKTL